MCAIGGVITQQDFIENTELIERLKKIQNHRGPDNTGIYKSKEESLLLVHNRLSILDLSAEANQPFISTCKRYLLIYNGEIYNFKSLKQKYNLTTTTQSDTEVLLLLLIQEGKEILKELDGMFAFALWDRDGKKLLLARDRTGQKPLFYYHDGETFVFCSELKFIYSIPEISKKLQINAEALPHFLHTGLFEGETTWLKHVKKLKQGNYLEYSISCGCFKIEPYYSFEYNQKEKAGSNQKDILKSLIEDSVKEQLVADVPVGTFLSGGVDSSLISAIATKHYTGKLKTFSIGFENAKFNELPYARKVATHLGTEHHEKVFTQKDAAQKLYEALDAYDEPISDSSVFPTLLLAEETAKHVKVSLSGDGGDELFMGYGTHIWANRLNGKNKELLGILNRMIPKTSNRKLEKLKNILEGVQMGNSMSEAIFSTEQNRFPKSVIPSLLRNSISIPDLSISHSDNVLLNQYIHDFSHYLSDNLLPKVDRASMHYSLEVRVPLLQNDLMTFAHQLPYEQKIREGVSKCLLKEVLYDYLPKEYFNRPKWGFGSPLAQLLQTDWHFLFEKYLSEEKINEAGFFYYSQVRKLSDNFRQGNSNLAERIWLLIVWQMWYFEKYKKFK